jgi:hypothetical protein
MLSEIVDFKRFDLVELKENQVFENMFKTISKNGTFEDSKRGYILCQGKGCKCQYYYKRDEDNNGKYYWYIATTTKANHISTCRSNNDKKDLKKLAEVLSHQIVSADVTQFRNDLQLYV